MTDPRLDRHPTSGLLTLAVALTLLGCTAAGTTGGPASPTTSSASTPSVDEPPDDTPALTGTRPPTPSPGATVDRSEMARLLREEAGPRPDADPLVVTRKTISTLVEKIDSGSGDVTDDLTDLLAMLPGSDDLTITWDHPDIGDHLGGVWLRSPDVIMLNSQRLSAERDRAVSTLLHEIVHTYQGRIVARLAEEVRWSDALKALQLRLDKAFDGNGLERSADCVALELGATWTHYVDERDCDSVAQRQAVTALLQIRMP